MGSKRSRGGLRVLLDTPHSNHELDEVDDYNQSAIQISPKRTSSALAKIDEKALKKGQMGPPSLNPKRLSREGLLFLLKKKSSFEKDRMLFGVRRSFSLDLEIGTAHFKDLPKSDESDEESNNPVVPFVFERGRSRTRVAQEANKGVKYTGTRPDPLLFAASNAETANRGNFRDITPPLKVSKPRKPLNDNFSNHPATRSASAPLPPRTQGSTIDKMDYMIDSEMSNDQQIPPMTQPGSPVVALLSSSFSQVAIFPLPSTSQTAIDFEYRSSSAVDFAVGITSSPPAQTKKGGKRGRDEEESPQKVFKKTKILEDGQAKDCKMNERSETEEDFGSRFDPEASMEL